MPEASPTPFSSNRSTRHLALVLIFLVGCSVIGLVAWESATARNQALDVSQVTMSNLARSLLQHADDTVGEAETVLDDLIERVHNDGVEGPQHDRLHRLLKRKVAALDQLHGLFIYSADGRWLVSSNDIDPANANNADREYFLWHRSHPGQGVHLGKVIISRSTGELIIPLSRRLDDTQGNFAGVILATLKVDYFNQFYKGFDLDDNGSIVLTLGDGTVLVRRPYDPKLIGSSIAKGELFAQMLPHAPSGARMIHSVLDGVERMAAYRASSIYPLVVLATQPEVAVLAGWRANLMRSIIMVVFLLSVLGLFGALLLRQIRRNQRTQADLLHAHAALQQLAMQDGLTGLANRRQLDLALPREIGRTVRSGRPLGLIMLDIDHFKRFNDLYGHLAGDGCIRDVGQAVVGCVGRAGDLVVRYGGEELLVLLPESDAAGTWRVAQRIVEAVRALAIAHGASDQGVVTVSAGIHVWTVSHPLPTPEALIAAADSALYSAKHNGRNQVFPLQSSPLAVQAPATH
jgi:diguanylate cyclase